MLININQLLPEEIGRRISNVFKIQNKNKNEITIKLKNPFIHGADGEQLEISKLNHGFNINDNSQLIVDIDCRCGAGTFHRALKKYNYYVAKTKFTSTNYEYNINCYSFGDLISLVIGYFRMCLILWGIAFGLSSHFPSKHLKNNSTQASYSHQNKSSKSKTVPNSYVPTNPKQAKNDRMRSNHETSKFIKKYLSPKSSSSQNNHKINKPTSKSSSNNLRQVRSKSSSMSRSQIAEYDKSVTASLRSSWLKHNRPSAGDTLADDIKSRMDNSYDSNVTHVQGINNSSHINNNTNIHDNSDIKSGRSIPSFVLKKKAIAFAKTVPVFKEIQLTNRFPIGNARAKRLYDYLKKKSLIRKNKSEAN